MKWWHVTIAAQGTREQMGRLPGSIAQALGKGLVDVAEVEPARIRPVDGRPHLESLVSYVLTQTWRHKIAVHPAAWRGSCLADLVGARKLQGFDPSAISGALPRWDIEERALSAVGLGNAPLDSVTDEQIRSLGAAALWSASAAAIGRLALESNEPEVAAARVAYAHLAKDLPDARDAAGLSKAGWYRLRERPVDQVLLDTIRRRLALDLRVRDVVARTQTAREQPDSGWARA
jgi:hypothetical protein